jgi:hypothetical protein
MSWSIACFCGTIYTAPPDRCPVCGSTVDRVSPRPTAGTTDVDAVAARAVTDADLRALTAHSLHT